MSDSLPSIDDFIEELPSVDEVIKEENLPSVDEFLEPPRPEEEIADNLRIENPDESDEIEEGKTDLTEVLHLINAVRKDIPEIPEIKYYDNELQKLEEYVSNLKESLDKVPEVKYYDREVEAICEQIDLVREEIQGLPEVKYYDEEVDKIEDRIDSLQQDLVNLPEVKYYDVEIEAICEAIDQVRESIPVFPKWVNEVNEVPDFTWIGKTFSVIDDDFIKVGDNIKSLKERMDQEVSEISENFDLKDFENKVEFDNVKNTLEETKNKIYEELKETAIKIWSHHDQFKDDDRKLKKHVLSKLNEARQNVEKQIAELDDKTYQSNKSLQNYFEGLKEEIASLPEPKNYDNTISSLRKDVKRDISKLTTKFDNTASNIAELYKLVGDIKGEQQELLEIYNDRPITPDPDEKQGDDPLTPTGQQFATLKDLAANYRLFVNRVEQQLYTIGGGGAGFLKDLDDVNISGLADGDTILWNASTEKWDVGAAAGAGSTIWSSNTVGIATTASVGIATASAHADYALYVGGNFKVDGDIVYDEVTGRNLNISGIATASTFNVGVGGTDLVAEIKTKTSLGLAIALG